MLTINQLMRYLRSKHHITVKSNQSQSLRNMATIMVLRAIGLSEPRTKGLLFLRLMKSLL